MGFSASLQSRRSRGTSILSIIVPCYNEEEVITLTHERLFHSLGMLGLAAFEVIYVSDGSRDRTEDILAGFQTEDPRTKLVSFSRNFGHQLAVTAGLDYASGDAAVIIDADLQDPPEMIEKMLEKWEDGYDVVYGVRKKRAGETAFKKLTAHLYYRFLNALSDTEIPLDTGDFRLVDRVIVDELAGMKERERFVRGLVSWVGFNQTPIYYEREERAAGESKYPLLKMIRFASNGILSFSIQPLRIANWIGSLASALALGGIAYALIMRLMTNSWVSGWTLLFIAVLFMGGVQLLVLGVLGEYIGRTYEQSKQRPLYIVRATQGFESAEKPVASAITNMPKRSSPSASL